MRNSNFDRKVKAAALSFVMAASMTAPAVVPVFTSVAESVSVGTSLAVKDKYIGYTAELGSSGIKTITFTCVADYTGNFTYGFGIGTAEDPYWLEYDGTNWAEEGAGVEVAVTEGEEFTITIDVSSLTLSYNPTSDKYPGKYEFRNYYSGKDGTVKIVSAEANAKTDPTKPTEPTNPTNPNDPTKPTEPDNPTIPNINVIPENNLKSGAWSFKDNGDGTATISTTVTKQIEGLEYVLTKGFDEDYYASKGEEITEESPINSHKFSYKDFGITDMTGVTIESLTATIESDKNIKTFMYGGGLNVEKSSPADTEYAKQVAGIEGKETAGYWYNDMGAEEIEKFEAQGVEFGVEPAQGVTVSNCGTYYEAYWEVPEAVQPYTTGNTSDTISFQYWYGEEDAEEYTELDTVKLTGAALTYTKAVVVPYTNSVKTAV
ncbi:MAG: DUF5620 domain-containing protein, partial [Oscillospiraceae bacterium]|nr:DUF5620 domain-containing protein [Oscillospiraceae bacterium]